MPNPVLASLLRINRQRMRQLRQELEPYSYVGTMHLIVLYTRRNPGASQEEIAQHYALDKASVARDARRLEEMGHIRRQMDPKDRRQYQLYLTEAGRRLLPVLDGVQERFAEQISQGMTPEEWETLIRLLGQVEQNCFSGAGELSEQEKTPERGIIRKKKE